MRCQPVLQGYILTIKLLQVLVNMSRRIFPQIVRVLLATNQQPAAVNGNRTLASFPPKNPDATSLPVPPSDLNSIRLTSPMNAPSPTADDDSNSGADDDLADNDTSQGIIHGEHIIRLRKRVRTVSMVTFVRNDSSSTLDCSVITQVQIGSMAHEFCQALQGRFVFGNVKLVFIHPSLSLSRNRSTKTSTWRNIS